MESKDAEKNQIGVATYLIDKLALRVGNEKGEDEADTVGCCSLRVEHINVVEGESKLEFDFLGKDSMRYHNIVEVEPIVYKLVARFRQNKEPKDDVFDLINASKLNDHFKMHMDDLSAKVFRTYNASYCLQNQLQVKGTGVNLNTDLMDLKKKFYDDCNRDVAILCNHKKAVSKNYEEQRKKMDEYIDEKKKELKALEIWKKKLQQAEKKKEAPKPGKNDKDMPKTAEICASKMKKLQE